VSLDEWILALHVLSAFAFVGGIVLFWVLIIASRTMDSAEDTIRIQPIARLGARAVAIGATGTLVLGIWLAFSYGEYDIWDPWIVAAILLWLAAGGVGGRTGTEYNKALDRARELESDGQTGPDAELLALNRTSRGVVLHAIGSLLLLLLLVDMIWKPGA
jgi:hypothetical protein